MTHNLQPEERGDAAAIHAVHRACFPTEAEARLVDALRAAGRLAISLVARSNDAIVGHVAFSPVSVEDGRTGAGLGPLAVLEAHRRKGIAAQLIERGLADCRAAGFDWVVVLGDPAYYSRIGFRPAFISGLFDAFSGGPAFQALELVPGKLPIGAGLVRYAAEFSALE